ncbi:MAG: DUF3944 domain-containing protein [Enterobacter cloacae]|nr:DUF3944 domain-containing protein [Enterobacter cloacae]MDU2519712.1 DUF3944 domain-containing protein [Enterobacter cloacae]MDU2666159.1 DUF3944 domain-containing protein [Enterobacter cloacae]
MAVYRDDVDLQFLGRCENEDLIYWSASLPMTHGIKPCAGRKRCPAATTTNVFTRRTVITGRRLPLKSRPSVPAVSPVCSEAEKACCIGKCYAMSVTIQA